MNPRGVTGVMCNFGSGGRVTLGFALCKRYVFFILKQRHKLITAEY